MSPPVPAWSSCSVCQCKMPRRCAPPQTLPPPAAEAVNKIVLELSLLGFVSLLLTTFSGPLGRMCGTWGKGPAAAAAP
jgi:hypothetical protein